MKKTRKNDGKKKTVDERGEENIKRRGRRK